ncbi:MAG: hypothetical protein AB7K09_22080 [Planctomycetota bacterium]
MLNLQHSGYERPNAGSWRLDFRAFAAQKKLLSTFAGVHVEPRKITDNHENGD